MNFMSIEAAARKFLFYHEPGPSLNEVEELSNVKDQDREMPPAPAPPSNKEPFFHNHLHDLESLWWVAVWVVFYNHFLERTSSHDPPSEPFTLQDAQGQLKLAKILFPPTLDSAARGDGFQKSESFQEVCNQLPGDKRVITAFYSRLDLLRRLLIEHYGIIEAGYPPSVDPSLSSDNIYEQFTKLFSSMGIFSRELELNYVPDVCAKLLKEEKKRGRSESMNDSGAAQKRKQ